VRSNPYTDFAPRGYIADYFSTPDGENTEMMRFHAEVHARIPDAHLMLELGGGPTIYQIISAAPHTDEIHFADYVSANLREIEAWRAADPHAYDWSPFVRRALELEGRTSDDAAIAQREAIVRSKLTRFLFTDALAEQPIGPNRESYDKVAVNFVLEGITDSYDEWHAALLRLASLVRVGGHFIYAAVVDSTYWFIGDTRYPNLPISEAHLREALPAGGFEIEELRTIPSNTPDVSLPDFRGYPSIALLLAQRLR
jgi:hypothetical protein